jgi:topoisomerase IV subunit B
MLLELTLEKVEERQRRKAEKDIKRKAPARRLRLPGKLADCTRSGSNDTEIFLVEGDSAGGSAKQARDRETQAVLPLRGKILNVASASDDKKHGNQEIKDLLQALGCGTGKNYREEDLRYDRVVIMTDADVDGAHIAALLMTFFYRELPGLIADGHLYLAVPPLYRLSRGGDVAYAQDDAHKDRLMKERFNGSSKVEISRFKGLGEMPVAQLKATTMSPRSRQMLRIEIPDGQERHTHVQIENLMGRKPELRLKFIQDHATEVEELDV